MTLTELQKEIFEVNKANGWHDKMPSKLEQHALFHTEITEAYNEYIAGKLETWYQPDGKPEGFYTELADVVIRILDYFSLEWYNVEEFEPADTDVLENIDEYAFLLHIHSVVSSASESVRKNNTEITEMNILFDVIGLIDQWLIVECSNRLTDLITEKIAYNKTRGHRHGGKVI